MSIKNTRQMKEKERKEIACKIAAGQTLKEHIEEVSAFDKEAMKRSSIVMNINGVLVEMRQGEVQVKVINVKKRKSSKKKKSNTSAKKMVAKKKKLSTRSRVSGRKEKKKK